ncbi:MAG: protein-disulfide reductase DsbD family protein [Hyphomicrobiaceae bacterium]
MTISRREIMLAIAGSSLAHAAFADWALAAGPALATEWTSEHATRVRLVGGGHATGSTGRNRLLVGVEITMDKDWKTYWRNPGSSGVPPRLEWDGSQNLAGAEVLYPAPHRFPDREGDTIGYKGAVVLPVLVTPKDASKPVGLKLALEYGVCKDVCVPVQPSFNLELPADAATRSTPKTLAAALAAVPRPMEKRHPRDPAVRKVSVVLAGRTPGITIAATFPPDGAGADAFLEAPDGLWVPLAKSVAGAKGAERTFFVDLTDGADIADLKGKTIRLTLVSAAGACETTFKME